MTFSGANFAVGTTVTIGGIQASNVSVVNAATITATTAQHPSGTTDVAVTSDGRTVTLRGAFTYLSPGPIVNTPPTITALSAQGTKPVEPAQFADVNEIVNLIATVQDAETPSERLTYEWSSPQGGTFTGSGTAVQWRAPESVMTPLNLTLMLTVVERYNDADTTGLPTPKEHRVTRSTTVSVHDSAREVGAMARQFLLDFSDSTIRDVSYIMRNFTMTCGEAKQELGEVSDNRVHHKITSYSVSSPAVTVNFSGLCRFRARSGDACAQVPVDWKGIYLDDGSPEHVFGVDQVTAKYLPNEGGWKLCGSDFDGQPATLNLLHPFIR